jgi:cell pole-organizing protein PopZ
MTQSAKAQEPSMEEILASIRRIIADDDANKPRPAAPQQSQPAPRAPPPRSPAAPPRAAPPPPPPEPVMNHDDIETMLAGLDAPARQGTDSSDILDLTESMTAGNGAAPPPSFRTIDGESDVVFTDSSAAPPEEPVMPHAAEEPRWPAGDRPLLSSSTSAAIDSAFNTLAHTVLVQNSRTLEDLVREMLRPLLKAWLDDNLPGLVERIVKAEIERVSRGRD